MICSSQNYPELHNSSQQPCVSSISMLEHSPFDSTGNLDRAQRLHWSCFYKTSFEYNITTCKMKSSQLITPYHGTIFPNVRLCSSKYTWYPRSNFDILEGKRSHSSRIRRKCPDLACKTYVLDCFNPTFEREILSDFQDKVLLWSLWSLISIKSCLPLTTITAVNFYRLLFVINSTDKAFIVSVLMYVPFFVWWIKGSLC